MYNLFWNRSGEDEMHLSLTSNWSQKHLLWSNWCSWHKPKEYRHRSLACMQILPTQLYCVQGMVIHMQFRRLGWIQEAPPQQTVNSTGAVTLNLIHIRFMCQLQQEYSVFLQLNSQADAMLHNLFKATAGWQQSHLPVCSDVNCTWRDYPWLGADDRTWMQTAWAYIHIVPIWHAIWHLAAITVRICGTPTLQHRTDSQK